MFAKTPLTIVAAIIVLTAIMLLVLEPPGQQKKISASNGSQGNVVDQSMSTDNNTAEGDDIYSQLRREIQQAKSNEELKALSDKIADTVPAARLPELLQSLFDHWITLDMTAALDNARRMKRHKNAGLIMDHSIVFAGQIDFPSVYNWIMNLAIEEAERKALINALYYGVGKNSPGFALSFIDLLNDGSEKDLIMQSLVEQWAAKDLNSVLSWLNSKQLSESMQQLKESLVAKSVQSDSDISGELIRDMEMGEEKYQLIREYAAKLAKENFDEATAWARSLNDPEANRIAMSAIYEAWITVEPDKQKVLERLVNSGSESKEDLINEISLNMASEDPAAVAKIIDQIPQSARPDVADRIVRFWQERNPVEALNWIDQLDGGITRDRASSAILESLLAANQNDEALSLINEMQNQSIRFAASRRLIESLNEYDPEGAISTLNGLEFLNNNEKQSILASLRNKPD